MEIDYLAIGKRIRKYRLEQNITQESLSEMAGLTPAHFSHIETGNTKVSLPSLIRIAVALGVSLDDLVYDNISRKKHVAIKEIDTLLSDCSDSEAHALAILIDAGKKALRSM